MLEIWWNPVWGVGGGGEGGYCPVFYGNICLGKWPLPGFYLYLYLLSSLYTPQWINLLWFSLFLKLSFKKKLTSNFSLGRCNSRGKPMCSKKNIGLEICQRGWIISEKMEQNFSNPYFRIKGAKDLHGTAHLTFLSPMGWVKIRNPNEGVRGAQD